MILLTLTWVLMLGSLSTLGSGQILLQERLIIRYPEIHSTLAIDCDCGNNSCDQVYWFHTNSYEGKVRYIGKCNNADRDTYGKDIDASRYKITKRSSVSTLRISEITKEDTGVYSCLLKDNKNTEVWKPGFLLLPGVKPPTEPPKIEPKPSVKPVCSCSDNPSEDMDGCGFLIFWPLVGIIATLALALICVLYYFSRLPKKCRHHFVKRR